MPQKCMQELEAAYYKCQVQVSGPKMEEVTRNRKDTHNKRHNLMDN